MAIQNTVCFVPYINTVGVPYSISLDMCQRKWKKHCYGHGLFVLIRKKVKTQGVDSCLSFYACPCDLIFMQRLINLPCALLFLWLFKIPLALFHRQTGVLHIPQSWCRETEKIPTVYSCWFVEFKNARNRFFKFSNHFMCVNVIKPFLCNAESICCVLWCPYGYSEYCALWKR